MAASFDTSEGGGTDPPRRSGVAFSFRSRTQMDGRVSVPFQEWLPRQLQERHRHTVKTNSKSASHSTNPPQEAPKLMFLESAVLSDVELIPTPPVHTHIGGPPRPQRRHVPGVPGALGQVCMHPASQERLESIATHIDTLPAVRTLDRTVPSPSFSNRPAFHRKLTRAMQMPKIRHEPAAIARVVARIHLQTNILGKLHHDHEAEIATQKRVGERW